MIRKLLYIYIIYTIIIISNSSIIFNFPYSISLSNGNILIIHKYGITICDGLLSNIIEDIVIFNKDEEIKTELSLSKVTTANIDEYIISIINDKIYIFNDNGNLLYEDDKKILEQEEIADYYTLVPIKKEGNYIFYFIGFIHNASLYFLYYEYDYIEKTNFQLSKRIGKHEYNLIKYDIKNKGLSCQYMTYNENINFLICFYLVANYDLTFDYFSINTNKTIAYHSYFKAVHYNYPEIKCIKSCLVAQDHSKALVGLYLINGEYQYFIFDANYNSQIKKFYLKETLCRNQYYGLKINYYKEKEEYIYSCLFDNSTILISMFNKELKNYKYTFKYTDCDKIYGYSIIYSIIKEKYFIISDENCKWKNYPINLLYNEMKEEENYEENQNEEENYEKNSKKKEENSEKKENIKDLFFRKLQINDEENIIEEEIYENENIQEYKYIDNDEENKYGDKIYYKEKKNVNKGNIGKSKYEEEIYDKNDYNEEQSYEEKEIYDKNDYKEEKFYEVKEIYDKNDYNEEQSYEVKEIYDKNDYNEEQSYEVKEIYDKNDYNEEQFYEEKEIYNKNDYNEEQSYEEKEIYDKNDYKEEQSYEVKEIYDKNDYKDEKLYEVKEIYDKNDYNEEQSYEEKEIIKKKYNERNKYEEEIYEEEYYEEENYEEYKNAKKENNEKGIIITEKMEQNEEEEEEELFENIKYEFCLNQKRKYIPIKNKCINNCFEDNYFNFEFKNICYHECPHNTKPSINDICEIDCDSIKLFNNLCLFNQTNFKSKEELIDNILENIKNRNLISNESKVIKIDNTLFHIAPLDRQKNNDSIISTIYLDECEKSLRESDYIHENESLFIFKIDVYIEDYIFPVVEYMIFNYETGEKINLDICKGLKAELSLPIIIKEDNLDKYDSSSGYYNDICYTYKSLNGVDVCLKDRKNEYIENKLALCEVDCTLKEIDIINQKSLCNCNIKYNFFKISEIVIDKYRLYNNFDNLDNIANIKVMKCYHILFTKEGLLFNIGFFIIIPIIILRLIIIIIFYKRDFPKIKLLIIEIVKMKKYLNNKEIHENPESKIEIKKNNDFKKEILKENPNKTILKFKKYCSPIYGLL